MVGTAPGHDDTMMASWFETRGFAALLTMKVSDLVLRHAIACVSKDEATEPENALIVELVEVAHRLHDRVEIRARVQRVEQLRGIFQQRMRALDRNPHV